MPAGLAERVAAMVPAYSAFDLVEIAATPGRSVEETAEVYFDLAERLQIARLRDQITALPRDDRWNTMARAALRDDLYAAHAAIARDVLEVTGPGRPEERLGLWVERNETAVQPGRPDADRDLGERPVHRGHAVGGGPGDPDPGGGELAARTSWVSWRAIVLSNACARVGFPAWQVPIRQLKSRNCRRRLTSVEAVLDPEAMRREADNLRERAADPGLWDDQEKAQAVTRGCPTWRGS